MNAIALLTALVLMTGDADEALTPREAVDEWHRGRIERLHNPDGWLSLVGLFRLIEGENTFGSSSGNHLVFPAPAPARAGTFQVRDGEVFLEVAEGVEITAEDGLPEGALGTDADDETSILALGSLRFYVIERPGLLLVRLRDHHAPLLSAFQGIERYEYDPSWRVVARLEPYDEPRTVIIDNVMGTSSEQVVPAALVFEHSGQELRLDPIPSGDGYWLIYGDNTNGAETYGAGRYLYTEDVAEDGTVVIDFNRSYNPPCVFTDFATCPLPPRSNLLTSAVRAGEKMWGDSH